jgi:hypothetical protein
MRVKTLGLTSCVKPILTPWLPVPLSAPQVHPEELRLSRCIGLGSSLPVPCVDAQAVAFVPGPDNLLAYVVAACIVLLDGHKQQVGLLRAARGPGHPLCCLAFGSSPSSSSSGPATQVIAAGERGNPASHVSEVKRGMHVIALCTTWARYQSSICAPVCAGVCVGSPHRQAAQPAEATQQARGAVAAVQPLRW